MHSDETKRYIIEEARRRYPAESINKIAKEVGVAPRTAYLWCGDAGILPKRSRQQKVQMPQGNGHAGDEDLEREVRKLREDNERLKQYLDVILELMRKANEQ